MLLMCFVLFFGIFVMSGCKKAELSSVALSKEIKTIYEIDDKINLNDAKLVLKYDNGSQKEIELSENMISGFNTESIGNKVLTITYKNKTLNIDYTVNMKSVKSLLMLVEEKLVSTESWSVKKYENVELNNDNIGAFYFLKNGNSFCKQGYHYYKSDGMLQSRRSKYVTFINTEHSLFYFKSNYGNGCYENYLPDKESDYKGKTNAEIIEDWGNLGSFLPFIDQVESGNTEIPEGVEFSFNVSLTEDGKFKISIVQSESFEDFVSEMEIIIIIKRDGLIENSRFVERSNYKTEESVTEYKFEYENIPKIEWSDDYSTAKLVENEE